MCNLFTYIGVKHEQEVLIPPEHPSSTQVSSLVRVSSNFLTKNKSCGQEGGNYEVRFSQ